MSEPVGVAKVGQTSTSEIFVNTADTEVISAVLPGGSAVTFTKGTALVDGATAGTKAKYTNATAVNDHATGTGNGTATTFDLGHANVIESSVKVYAGGAQQNATLSKGTGTGGVDQVVLAVAPATAVAVKTDYSYHASSKGAEGACILMEDAKTTVAGGNVIVSGLVGGTVNSSKVKDAAAAAVDSYFKAALNKVRFS